MTDGDRRRPTRPAGRSPSAARGRAGRRHRRRRCWPGPRETFGDELVVASNMQDAVLVDLAAEASPASTCCSSTPATTSPRPSAPATRSRPIYRRADRQRRARADGRRAGRASSASELYDRDPNRCCALRKVVPLQRTLAGYDAWVTGVRRVEAPTRANTPVVAVGRRKRAGQGQPDRRVDRRGRRRLHRRARHPGEPAASATGYPSHRLRAVHRAAAPGADPRSGRWAGTGQDRMRAARMTRDRSTPRATCARALAGRAGRPGVRGDPHLPRGGRRSSTGR